MASSGKPNIKISQATCKTILVLNPRRVETFMRELLGEALEQAPR